MNLWKTFTHYFVPAKTNKYRPLFLRVKVASLVMLVIVGLFGLSVAGQYLLVASGSPQVAAVISAALVNLANDDRAQNNLGSLTVSPELQAAAQAKANDMAANGYFAHTSPSGRDPWYWFTQAGYNFSYGGENLAVYFSDSDAVNTAWMNSPEHRANILNGHFTQIGIATAEGTYQGHQTTFVVQEFGTPGTTAAVKTTPTSTVSTKPVKTRATVVKASPKVEGASTSSPQVKVITEDKTFIAVENENASVTPVRVASTTSSPSPNPISVFILKFVTSPQSDLVVLYEVIAGVVGLALVIEVFTELRRTHPHRIVLGLSILGLMVTLVLIGHVFLFGDLVII